jgi:hypothetical protein
MKRTAHALNYRKPLITIVLHRATFDWTGIKDFPVYTEKGCYDSAVPILQRSSADVRQRLLELFPVSNLRSSFSVKGSKESIAGSLARRTGSSQFDTIAEFVDENVQYCKQHIYVLSHSGDAELPESIPDGEQVLASKTHALYLARTTIQVVKLDPPEYDSIDFLWPVRIERSSHHVLVRFVVLEKAISSYFDRDVIVRGRSLSEESIVASLRVDGTLGITDLNRGVKALWDNDKIDAIKVKYTKPGSTNTQTMHEAKGLKKYDRKAYADLLKYPLSMSIFETHDEFKHIEHFAADPTMGMIGFTKYFKEGENGNELIRQILKSN